MARGFIRGVGRRSLNVAISAPAKILLIDPHTMQNDGELPRDGNAGDVITPPLGDLHAPGA